MMSVQRLWRFTLVLAALALAAAPGLAQAGFKPVRTQYIASLDCGGSALNSAHDTCASRGLFASRILPSALICSVKSRPLTVAGRHRT